ncbi:unnamed protein product [Prunus armeniaca]
MCITKPAHEMKNHKWGLRGIGGFEPGAASPYCSQGMQASQSYFTEKSLTLCLLATSMFTHFSGKLGLSSLNANDTNSHGPSRHSMKNLRGVRSRL